MIFSCGEKKEEVSAQSEDNSIIGNWTSNDMQKCKKEGTEKLGQAPEDYWSKYHTTLEAVVECHCKELEKVLESYSVYRLLSPDDLRNDYDYEWRDCLKQTKENSLRNDDYEVEKVEYKLSLGYIYFDKPIGCEEVKEEDLPPSAPEGTVCFLSCNNVFISFRVTNDYNMYEEEEITRTINNSKYINNYDRGMESSGEVVVFETNFTKINDVPALQTIAIIGDMDFLVWNIYDGFARIEITAIPSEAYEKDFINKIVESVSYSLTPPLMLLEYKIDTLDFKKILKKNPKIETEYIDGVRRIKTID